MSAADVEVARRFIAASEQGQEAVFSFCADDVVWSTDAWTLSGLAEVQKKLRWEESQRTNTDVAIEDMNDGEWEHLGDGRVAREWRFAQRSNETGNSTVTCVRETLTVRDGKISRYEWRGHPE
jgi:ketosteroid isomerase-like protein